MDHLGIDNANLLGMSLGGMVAQEVAINHPKRVWKLVLVCTSTGEGEISDVHPEMLRAIGVKEGSDVPDLRSVDFTESMGTIVSLAFNKRLYRMILVQLSKLQMRRIGVEAHIQQMEAVIGYSTVERLHLIASPTLVITGTEDRIISPRSSDEIASKILNARLVRIDGGSHAFSMEMRGRFNREVLDFLRGG